MTSPASRKPAAAFALAAAAALGLAAAPPALGASATISGSIRPNKGPIGSPFTLKLAFAIAPSAAGEEPTLNHVTLLFPNNARPNGALFPTCSEQTIDAKRGHFTDCPKGSRIGTGKVIADVPAIDGRNIPAVLTFFNAGASKITMHVKAIRPVPISEAITGTIRRVGGRYGYQADFAIPDILQEISDGWFAVEKSITSTIGATRVVRGRTRGYLESTTLCPRALSVPIAASFSFRPGHGEGPAAAESAIACRR